MNHTQNNFADLHQNGPIFLVRGECDNRPVWHYVQVDKLKLPLYKRAVTTDSIDVADYGKVLASGWGEEPPESVKKRIEELAD